MDKQKDILLSISQKNMQTLKNLSRIIDSTEKIEVDLQNQINDKIDDMKTIVSLIDENLSLYYEICKNLS